MNKQELIQMALTARDNAYVPYSDFRVGAALLMKDGKVICGVNVENVSYGATNCAERSAIFTAISQGYTKGDFAALAVTANSEVVTYPCSICRQVMVELFDENTPIHVHQKDGYIETRTVAELVPYSFKEIIY